MIKTILQKAKHGWNVVGDGFAYPFKTYNAALKLHCSIDLIDKAGMLLNGGLHRFSVKGESPSYVFHSLDSFEVNESVIEDLVVRARANRTASLRPNSTIHFIDYFDAAVPPAYRTATGASLLYSRYLRAGETRAQAADRVFNVLKSRLQENPPLKLKLDIDSVLGKAWTGSTPATPQVAEAASPKQKEPVNQVYVESIDPRKLPLFHYVNGDLLPDPPKDAYDCSTEACYKRQAHTIKGLLQDLEQRTKALQQANTEHEVTKTKLDSVTDSLRASQKEVFTQAVSSFNEGIRLKRLENGKAADNKRIADLLADNKSYREQVLKNSESIAVVKYRNGNGYRLVVDGNAYFKNWYGDTEASLLKLANNINCGKVSISCPTLALIRETYNKEDYA